MCICNFVNFSRNLQKILKDVEKVLDLDLLETNIVFQWYTSSIDDPQPPVVLIAPCITKERFVGVSVD